MTSNICLMQNISCSAMSDLEEVGVGVCRCIPLFNSFPLNIVFLIIKIVIVLTLVAVGIYFFNWIKSRGKKNG